MTWFPNADRDNGGDAWSNLIGDARPPLLGPAPVRGALRVEPERRSDLEEFDFAVGLRPEREAPDLRRASITSTTRYDVVYGAGELARVREVASARLRVLRHPPGRLDRARPRGQPDRATTGSSRSSSGADFDKDEFSFSIGFEPRFLFDAILRPRGLRREPEFQYLGSRIIR